MLKRALTALTSMFIACGGGAVTPDATTQGDSSQVDDVELPLPPELANAKRIVWVGAHPDDETVAAPLLARLCLASGVTCTFLVFTKGEGGSCGLASCGANLGDFRAAELRTSAAHFRADVVQWDLGNEAANTIDDALANFVAHAGSNELLVQKIGDEIARLAPDAIITFDPRNGVTCHPDHRATAAALIVALKNRPLVSAAQTWLLATRLVTDGRDLASTAWIGHEPYAADPAAKTLAGAPWWQYVAETLRAHQSQFQPSTVEKFEAAPTDKRIVSVLALRDVVENDARYVCGQ